jgi:uncharacterized membrane protein
MIEAHVLDSWTRVADRRSTQFAWAMTLGGLGAPLFLFLAGTAVALSAGSKARRTGDTGTAARAAIQRGLWVFCLAFLFRVQAWILGWGPARSLLKVDILNIMGPSIMAAGALWGAFRTSRARAIAFGGATLVVALMTPMVRSTHLLDALPDPVEAYVRPIRGLSNFCLFPWAGFLFAGALVGVLVDEARTQDAETRLNMRLFASGAALSLGAYTGSYLPSLFGPSEFWGGSPAFCLLRVGLITASLAIAYAWERRPTAARWSPIQQLGRTSLFIYWIHVEMVYGLISGRLHHGLSHRAAWMALGAFTAFMLLCSLAKDRASAWWRNAAAPRPLLPVGDGEPRDPN